MRNTDWLILFALCLVWAVGAFGYWLRSRDLGALFLSVNAFAVLVAAYMSVITAWRTSQMRQDQIRFDRIENAFAFIDKWDSPLYSEARDAIREMSKNPTGHAQDDVREKVLQDASLERSVIAILNFFGEIELSLKFDRANEDLLFDTFWEPYKIVYPMLETYREKDLKRQYREWLHSLDSLYDRWQERAKNAA